MPEYTEIIGEDMLIGSKDISNFIRQFIKGYRFTHQNKDPRKMVMPRVLFVDGILVEYEQVKIVVKEVKSVDKTIKLK